MRQISRERLKRCRQGNLLFGAKIWQAVSPVSPVDKSRSRELDPELRYGVGFLPDSFISFPAP